MQTDLSVKPIITTLTEADRGALEHLVRAARGRVRLPPAGKYKRMTADDLWLALVSQVCVKGSSRGMERIARDAARRKAFGDAVQASSLRRHRSVPRRLAHVLAEFKATRFPMRSATTLAELLDTETVFAGDCLVLLDGLPTDGAVDALRTELRRRCPAFNMKSASDFMINVGLSHDVIALDTRVVGALRRYFEFNLPVSVVQSRPAVYLSVEGALRDACAELGVPLAQLDRAIFQLAGRTALDFVMEGR